MQTYTNQSSYTQSQDIMNSYQPSTWPGGQHQQQQPQLGVAQQYVNQQPQHQQHLSSAPGPPQHNPHYITSGQPPVDNWSVGTSSQAQQSHYATMQSNSAAYMTQAPVQHTQQQTPHQQGVGMQDHSGSGWSQAPAPSYHQMQVQPNQYMQGTPPIGQQSGVQQGLNNMPSTHHHHLQHQQTQHQQPQHQQPQHQQPQHHHPQHQVNWPQNMPTNQSYYRTPSQYPATTNMYMSPSNSVGTNGHITSAYDHNVASNAQLPHWSSPPMYSQQHQQQPPSHPHQQPQQLQQQPPQQNQQQVNTQEPPVESPKKTKAPRKTTGPRKKRATKEMNEGQRKSGYAQFFSEKQKEIKSRDPKIGSHFGEISKIVSAEWSSLSDEDRKMYNKGVTEKRRETLSKKAAEQAKKLQANFPA